MADRGETTPRAGQGCLVCRSRKVKCDKSSPGCLNCERLGVQCPGYGRPSGPLSRAAVVSSVEGIYRASGVEKRRVGSCDQCRRSKSRCSRTRPICRRCSQKSLDCTYPVRFEAPPDGDGSNPSASVRSEGDTSREDATASPEAGLSPASTSSHWLLSKTPPQDPSRLRLLFDVYFERIHPLRCLGFIHKPLFLQALDRGTLLEEYGESLVWIVAACGARAYCQDDAEDDAFPAGSSPPGESWAEQARESALAELDSPSLMTLASLILVTEYALYTDQFSLAFTLVGICYRLTRLLGLEAKDAPGRHGGPPPATQVEAGRRLLWACYILDGLVGLGVDGNLCWKDSLPRAPLPSPEGDFIAQTSALALNASAVDVFQTPSALVHLDYRAHIIYLTYLRTRALRLIRSKDQPYDLWQPRSPFLQTIQQLETWYSSLPDLLLIHDLNAYVHKELNILGAVYMLHFYFHTVVTDLTRISLPGYAFPLASAFRAAPLPFIRQCQNRCRYHADVISKLVRSGLVHGRLAFDDMHCATAAFEAAKIQIVHTATTGNGPEERSRASDNIRACIRLLDLARVGRNKPSHFRRALLPLLARFGFHDIVSEWRDVGTAQYRDGDGVEVVGPVEEDYLNQTTPFRLATAEIQARRGRGYGHPLSLAAGGGPSTYRPPVISPTPAIVSDAEGSVSGTEPPMPSTATTSGNYRDMVAAHQSPAPSGFPDRPAEDFEQIAGEMSGYLSWDVSETQGWTGFGPPPTSSGYDNQF